MVQDSASGGLVYPNPGSTREWVDATGRRWTRRGTTWPDERRTRTLLRRERVPLATWSAGEVAFYEAVAEKRAAADGLRDAARSRTDVVASEWESDDGTVLLLLEHHC